MKDNEKGTKSKSFWETLPGIFTGLAAVLTAIIGLITAVLSLPKPNIFFPATATSISSSTPSTFATPTGQPVLLPTAQFQNKVSSGLYYYDFDGSAQASSLTSGADFYFQPQNAKDSNSAITVSAYNGAKFDPQSAGIFPWNINPSQMTSAQGVYSVPQRAEIPCITSQGKYCTFSLALNNNGDLLLTVKLYELH